MTSTSDKNMILFRFLRNNNDDGSSDDIATISYVGNNKYSVSFKTGYTNGKKKTVSMSLDDRQTFRWVRRTLALLECDTEPFTGIQLDTPMMPSIMITVNKIASSYSSLLDAVEFHMDNWVNTVSNDIPRRCAVRNIPHSYTVEEEDTDESMPPLVPAQSAFRTPPRLNRQHLFFDEE
jgi:hypothetical protein